MSEYLVEVVLGLVKVDGCVHLVFLMGLVRWGFQSMSTMLLFTLYIKAS